MYNDAAIILSMKPKWCDLILSGHKTIEIRKTIPDIQIPFTVYIYKIKYDSSKADSGKIVGEFVCNNIRDARDITSSEFNLGTCMTIQQWHEYTATYRGNIYALYVSNVKRYANPIPITRFHKRCENNFYKDKCMKCKYSDIRYDIPSDEFYNKACHNYIQRASQSWCYCSKESTITAKIELDSKL